MKQARKPPIRAAGATRIDGVARRVVSPADWRRAREAMTAKEKAHMRAGDALAAERRRMPWLKVDKTYRFEGPNGRVGLVDLFEGRKQLLLYHFMYGPQIEGWPQRGCVGCSFVGDQICHLDHLHARDITLAFTSVAPYANIEAVRARMGWDTPWYAATPAFNRAFDVTDANGYPFGLNVFYRSGDDVYRTHFVMLRGIEALGTAWSFYDVTPLGRQETWQDAPAGSPQGEPYVWWRRHGEYGSPEEA